MPLIPKGLTPSFVNRIRERVQQELGQRMPGVMNVAPVQNLQTQVTNAPGAQSIVDRVQERQNNQQPPVLPAPAHTPASGPEEKRYRIQTAGRTRTLLDLEYNGIWRKVVPLSFRTTDAGNILFFGLCEKDNYQLNAFRFDKIQDAQVTTIPFPFQPTHPVELGSAPKMKTRQRAFKFAN